jgi:hypothetical protein
MSEVIGEPLIRLRADSAQLAADLQKAKAVAKAAIGEMKAVADANVAAIEKKLAGVGAALSKAEKAAAKEAKAIQAHLDRLNATRANASIGLLEKAVQKAGGVAKLSAEQLSVLTRQVERLAAAGAKVPKSLVIPKAGGLGAGLQAGLGAAAGNLAPGGAVGAGLSAIGPAGLVAAAGLGAVTLGAKAAFDALSDLAGQAERWTNVATATGLGVKEVQQLEAFLEDAGFQAGDLEKAMKKLATEITTGGDSLAKFGIDVRELKGLAPEEQLRELARQVTAIVDPTERAAAATEAFGKGGARALAALQGIASGAFKEMETLSQEAIDELIRVDAELDKAGRAWTNWKNEALVSLLHVVQAIKKFSTEGFGSAAIVRAFNPPKVTEPTGAEADSNRAAALAAAQQEIVAELARKQKAAALAREKKDAAGAEGRAAKAKAAAEAYRRELERLAEEEKRGQIAANERWEAEQKAVERVNEAVRKRISDAQVSIFGTSKQAATEAAFQFGILMEAVDRAGQSIDTLTAGQLAAFEAELVKLEKLTRADAAANDEVATTLGKVRARLREVGEGGFEEVKVQTDEVKKKTVEWEQQLQNISALIQSFPGGLGKVGSALSGLTAGAAGIGSGLDAFKKAGKAGGLGGLLGQIGAAGQIASAAVGIGQAIVGLFKSDPVKKAQKAAGKALGHEISREMAEQFLQEAKATGKSIEQVAKEWQRRVKAEQDQANLDTLRAGVGIAQQGAQELLGLMDQLSPKAQAAGGALVKAVADAMAANGLGFLATGELAKSEKFNAAQQAVGAAGQIVGGLRQAGGISTDLLASGGAFAEALRQQAVEAALEAGKSAEEAQKIGIATIAPLLRDQLNASIESGRELDANTKQLLEEARANGIEIVADPLIAQLEVQKEMLAELRKQNGSVPGNLIEKGGAAKVPEFASGGFGNFGAGTLAMLHGKEAIVPLDFSAPSLSTAMLSSGGRITAGEVSAHTGPGFGGMSLSMPVSITVIGANKSPQEIAREVAAMVRLGQVDLTRELDRKYSRP